MKAILTVLLIASAMVGFNGCGGDSVTVDAQPTEPVEVIIISETPPAVDADLFEEVRPTYVKDGDDVDMEVTMLSKDEIDPFSFIVEIVVDGTVVDYAGTNVGSDGYITTVTSEFSLEGYTGEVVISLLYYGEETYRLTRRIVNI